ncbi:MAG: hypothetical protein U9R58_13630 [Chloroflexota bacterium]|nr:hypothetical protein [Chloroflexota bacterium]
MNHKPYQEVIFSDRELTCDEADLLQDHILQCDDCYQLSTAWSAVEHELQTPQMVDPEPGFVARWQVRLEAEQKRRQNQQNLIMLSTTWGATAALLIAIVYLAIPLIQSSKVVLYTYLYQLLNLFSVVTFVQSLSSGLMDGLTSGIPWVAIVFAVGLITIMGVLWVVSLRVLTKSRSVTL